MDTGKVLFVADRLQLIAAELSTLQQHCLVLGAGEDSPYDLVMASEEQLRKAAGILRRVARAEREGGVPG